MVEMVVVVVGKLVVLPQGWQVVEEHQEGQTDQVEEVGHHIQSLELGGGERKKFSFHKIQPI